MIQRWQAVSGLVWLLGCGAAVHAQVNSTADYNRYLSPRCAGLNDAMRSAAQQGNYNTMRDLRREFMQKCSDEAQSAVQSASRERETQREQRQEQRRQVEQAQADSRALAQQCDGMRDVIQSKRKREATLNPTEVAALRQLETTFNERCLRR